tara:strand:- start:93 stop:548 length:456 start_codon:yes stop_codon:yes gene_type:complete
MSTVLTYSKITICSSNYLITGALIFMQNKENKVFDDDLTGEKERDLELLNKMNPDFFQRMMQNTDQAGMKPIEDRVDEFLGKVTDSNGMNSVGVQQKKQQTMMAHDYDDDPYIRKTIMEIINTPGYDPASVREAQRQLLRMNQGLPRFPTA